MDESESLQKLTSDHYVGSNWYKKLFFSCEDLLQILKIRPTAHSKSCAVGKNTK